MFWYKLNDDFTPKMSLFWICHQWNTANSVNKCHSKSQLSIRKTSCKSDFEYGPKNRFKRFTARRAFQNVCPQIKWKGGDEWCATAGVPQQMILSSFSDYANLSFWDEPTWMQSKHALRCQGECGIFSQSVKCIYISLICRRWLANWRVFVCAKIFQPLRNCCLPDANTAAF